jgi:enamine deaminase RidA (YjgF/YER057c/UK114 family)
MAKAVLTDPENLISGKGLLSQVCEISLRQAQRLIMVSGQVAWDADGQIVGADDFRAQFQRVLANIGIAMSSVGGGMDDIVAFRTYLTDENDLPAFFALREELYPSIFHSDRYPTNTLLVIQRLAEPGLRLEIEATAVL